MDLTPKKIDLYIFKKFITTFFFAMLLIIGIVIIFDISEKIDDFVSKEAPLRAIIFDYYVNFIPYFINMFSPLFVFITVIFFTSVMASNSEIIAILSGGVSYHRMMVPYMVAAALIAGLSLGLNLYVIPRSNATRLQFENKYVKQRGFYNRDIHYQIELLNVLRRLVRTRDVAVIMSLHELPLARKISDWVMCIKGDCVVAAGTPDEIFTTDVINELYDLAPGVFDPVSGNIQLEE